MTFPKVTSLQVLQNPEGTRIPGLPLIDVDDVIQVIDIDDVERLLGVKIPTAWELAIQLRPVMEV